MSFIISFFIFSVLLFCYLLFKVGICQCIVRSLCKMCWAACETYWYALEDITCFLWHKLLNTKRRNRRRRIRDAEWGYSSSSDGNDFSGYHRHLSSRRKRYMERNDWYGHDSHCGSRHHHVKLKTRQASFHLRGGSRRLRNSRRLHSMKVRNPRRISKRRRLKWTECKGSLESLCRQYIGCIWFNWSVWEPKFNTARLHASKMLVLNILAEMWSPIEVILKFVKPV